MIKAIGGEEFAILPSHFTKNTNEGIIGPVTGKADRDGEALPLLTSFVKCPLRNALTVCNKAEQ